MTPHPQRFRVQPYLDRALHDRLIRYCAATGATETAVVAEALRRLLDKTDDTTLLLRRLDRLGRFASRIHRDLELLSEAFGLWVRMWLAVTPPVADAARRSVRAASEGRYRQFVTHLAERFGRGSRFINDLPQESVAEPSELQDIADDHRPPSSRAAS